MRNTLKRNESNTLKCNVNNLNANFTKKYINCSLKTMHVPKLQNFIMSNISFQNITFSNVFFSKYPRTTSRLSSFTEILILPLHAIETGVDVALCCEFMSFHRICAMCSSSGSELRLPKAAGGKFAGVLALLSRIIMCVCVALR